MMELPRSGMRLLAPALEPLAFLGHLTRSCYRAARCNAAFFVQSLRDRVANVRAAASPFVLPPPRLRHRVHVSLDASSFLDVAKRDAATIVLALERHGFQLGAFSRILDWGCGPGKVIQALYWDHLHSRGEGRKPNLFGTDLSPSSVRWAARHIPFAQFSVNSPDPPLPFEAASFDFIYGISVFSHLDRQMESAWLAELHRVLRPGGLILVTFRGAHASSLAIREGSAEGKALRREGIVFRPPPKGYRSDGLPDCYGNTYHSEEYILARFSRHFEILNHDRRGLRGSQDVVLLRKSTY